MLSIDAVHVFLLVVKEISIIFIPKQILMIQITNKISRLLLVFLVSNLIAVNMYAGIIGGCPDNEMVSGMRGSVQSLQIYLLLFM